MSRCGTTWNQRWNNVVYFSFGIYSVEQRQVNVVCFNFVESDVRQRRKNVVLFNVEFYNVGQRGNNVVKKWPFLQGTKKNRFKLNTLNSKCLLLFYNFAHFTPIFKKNILNNTCKAAKRKIMKNSALQELDLNRFTL